MREASERSKAPVLWAVFGAILSALCSQTAAASDLSIVGQWKGLYPSDKVAGGKSLWDQPAVEEVLRAAMGARFVEFVAKDAHAPDAPVQSDGNGLFAAWACTNGEDCGGNNVTVFFDSKAGEAEVCWRSSEGIGGRVHDVWLASGKESPLPINGCGVGERHPFASFKKHHANDPRQEGLPGGP
jgi:hypothetical protein